MKKILISLGVIISLTLLTFWSIFIGNQIEGEGFFNAYIFTPIFLILYLATCLVMCVGLLLYIIYLLWGKM